MMRTTLVHHSKISESRLAQLYRVDDQDRKRIFQEIIDHQINEQLEEKPLFKEKNLFSKIFHAIVGNTALHLAMEMNDDEQVKELIKNGVDFTIKNSKGHTALLQHIEEDKLHYYTADCICCKPQDFYALHKFKGPIKHRINLVLSAHVKYNIPDNPSTNNGISHFHAACMLNNAKAVDFFLKKGVSPNESVNVDSKIFPGFTPLHFAARYSCVDVAKILLDRGALIDAKDAEGQTPLDILTGRTMEMSDWLSMETESPNKRLLVAVNKNKLIIEMILKKISHTDQILLAPPDSQTLDENYGTKLWIKVQKTFWQGCTPLPYSLHINVGLTPAKSSIGRTRSHLSLKYFSGGCLIDCSKPSWRDIRFANSEVTLDEFYKSMKDLRTFKNFITKIDLNTSIPRESLEFPGYTPLHLAIIFASSMQYIDIVKNAFDFQYNVGDGGYNFLAAPRNVYVEMVKFCLERGADVTGIERHKSPLDLALQLLGTPMAKLFLNSPTLTASTTNSISHIQIALDAGYTKLAETLKVTDTQDVNRHIRKEANCHLNIVDEAKDYFDTPDRKIVEIKENMTPLHIACKAANTQLVKDLLARGANLYALDLQKATPIHQAFKTRPEKAKELGDILFPKSGLKDRVSNYGLSHLHVACKLGNANAVKQLLDAKSNTDLKFSPNKLKLDHVTPLYLAATNHHKEVVKILLDRGADIFSCCKGKFFLQDIQKDHPDLFLRAIEKIVYKKNDANLTPLHVACFKLDYDAVEKRLFFDNANVRFKIEGNDLWGDFTPLHFLTLKRDSYDLAKLKSIADLLIEWEADVTLKNIDGFTPLHEALDNIFLQLPTPCDVKRLDCLHIFDDVYANKPHSLGPVPINPKEILNVLLRGHRDASVNPTDPRGISHFHIACICNQVDLVEKFLKNGVDINHKISDRSNYYAGLTAVHLAAYHKNTETLDLLLKFGADIHARNRVGNTPLHEAANYFNCSSQFGYAEKREEVVRSLVRAGADITVKNSLGQTPLELLMETKMLTTETFEMLSKDSSCVNHFNGINEVGLIGASMMYIYDVKDLENHPVYKAVINSPNKNRADSTGRTPIHNIVAMRNYSSTWIIMKPTPAKVFNEAVTNFVRLGFNIDQQDNRGQTALHVAAKFLNVAGINTLLFLGSDINIVDFEGQTPMSCCLKKSEIAPEYRIGDKYVKQISIYKNDCLNAFFKHVYKMKLVGLNVNEVNEKIYTELQKQMSIEDDFVKKCEEELKILSSTKVGSSNLYFGGFFVKIEILIAIYEKLKPRNRRKVDNVFQNTNNFKKEFPEFAGLLQMQYQHIQSKTDTTMKVTFIQKAKKFFSLKKIFTFKRSNKKSEKIQKDNVYQKMDNEGKDFAEFTDLLQMQHQHNQKKANIPRKSSYVQKAKNFFRHRQIFTFKRSSKQGEKIDKFKKKGLDVCDKLVNAFTSVRGWFSKRFAQHKKQ